MCFEKLFDIFTGGLEIGRSLMVRVLVFVVAALLMACTVNVYDYSTHSGGGVYKPEHPDTVYIAPGPSEISAPTVPPAEPDTIFSRRTLIGGGVVETAVCGDWTRHILTGCMVETDGVALEVRPVVIIRTSSDGAAVKEFKLIFNCRMQSFLVGSTGTGGSFSAGRSTSAGVGSTLPVVTGTELISIVADNTTFPFLAEESESYKGEWLPDGTLMYNAVYSIADWKMRAICTAENIIAVSTGPDFRIVFGEDSKRLLRQFYDIFVIHDGEAPVLPVRTIRN
jgi:hypothetical protein